MRILLTNDDGYRADGLTILAKKLSEKHSVIVVSPKKEKSGSSHSMTFYKDVNVRKVSQFDWECYHVDGTPVDCVRFGAEVVMKDAAPDLILSGINDVANVGTDILYSGTVHAAIQGYTLGYRAVAISTDFKNNEHFESVAEFILQKIDKLYALAAHGAVNVNYPHFAGGIQGIKLTPIGKNLFSDEFIVQKLSGGRIRYRLIGDPIEVKENPPDCDVNWFRSGYVTLSVLNNTFQENLQCVEEGFSI